MKLRFWMILIGIVSMTILNGAIIKQEEEVETRKEAVEEITVDTLAAVIRYQSGEAQREADLAQFGFDEEMTIAAKKEFKKLDKPDMKEKLKKQLQEAEDIDFLRDVFCRKDDREMDPRYAAIQVLIKQDEQGDRSVYDPKEDLALEKQEWSGNTNLSAVYEKIEHVPVSKRLEKSTIMSVAAYVSSKESDLLDGVDPWGLGREWDWDDASNPVGVKENVVKYICLMHVFTDLADDSTGICGE